MRSQINSGELTPRRDRFHRSPKKPRSFGVSRFGPILNYARWEVMLVWLSPGFI
jgi:hypothetical protein